MAPSEQLEQRIAQVSAYWSTLSEAELQRPLASGKWSRKEILGHLVDSAQTNIRRLVVGQYQPLAHIIYNQDIWVRAAGYQTYPTDDLLHLWVLLNRHFARIVAQLPASQLEVLTDWGKEKPELVSLGFVAEDYIRHLDHHLEPLYRAT